jgi:hypothetical protein
LEERVGERRPFKLSDHEIWHPLQRRSGCTQVVRKLQNLTYVPPPLEQLGKKPDRKPPWKIKNTRGRGM